MARSALSGSLAGGGINGFLAALQANGGGTGPINFPGQRPPALMPSGASPGQPAPLPVQGGGQMGVMYPSGSEPMPVSTTSMPAGSEPVLSPNPSTPIGPSLPGAIPPVSPSNPSGPIASPSGPGGPISPGTSTPAPAPEPSKPDPAAEPAPGTDAAFQAIATPAEAKVSFEDFKNMAPAEQAKVKKGSVDYSNVKAVAKPAAQLPPGVSLGMLSGALGGAKSPQGTLTNKSMPQGSATASSLAAQLAKAKGGASLTNKPMPQGGMVGAKGPAVNPSGGLTTGGYSGAQLQALQDAMPNWMKSNGITADKALAWAQKNPQAPASAGILAALQGGAPQQVVYR